MSDDDPRAGAARPDDVLPAPGTGDAGEADPLAALAGLDLSSLLGAASQVQQQFAEAEDEIARTELEGVAGGGAVRIRLTGAGDFEAVTIDAAAVDPAEVELLQDLVLAALHDATRQLRELQAQSLGSGLGGLTQLLAGGGLGDLFGAPGLQRGTGDESG